MQTYFLEYRILAVASLYILEVLCFIKKFKGYLKYNCRIHRYNKRSNVDLHTALFQKSVVNMSVKLYTRLPERIKTLSDFKSFKKTCKISIIKLFFYMYN
jgi:hypothetical protein